MTDNQSNSYQDILDKYAESISSKDNPQIPQEKIIPEPELEPMTPPEPILTSEEETLLKSQPEEVLNPPQIEAPPVTEAITSPDVPETIISPPPQIELPLESFEPVPKKENHFFKYLFFLSLIIFIIVLVLVIISFLNSQKPISNSQDIPKNNLSPTSLPVTFCEINDQKHAVGTTFPANDSCNTCTCGEDLTINCTTKTCDLTPTKPATTSAIPAAWKAYSINTDTALSLANYQIKLPSTWIQIEHSSNFQNTETFQDKSTNSTYKLTIDQEKNINPDTGKAYASLREFTGLSYDVPSLTVGGQTAAQGLPRAGSETYYKVLFFSKGNKLTFSIELDTPLDGSKLKEGEILFKQILSTFKFL